MIFIEDRGVLCRWPCSQYYNLESGGKTAALHIMLANPEACTRRRRTVGTRGGRCKTREERRGRGFARRDFRPD